MTHLSDTILPMAALAGLVVLMPMLLERGNHSSHRRLALTVLATAITAWLAGAALLALQYADANPLATPAPLAPAPLAPSARGPIFFLGRSTLFAMLWGPLLGLVWLVRAQEVNRRVGLQMVDGTAGNGRSDRGKAGGNV